MCGWWMCGGVVLWCFYGTVRGALDWLGWKASGCSCVVMVTAACDFG